MFKDLVKLRHNYIENPAVFNISYKNGVTVNVTGNTHKKFLIEFYNDDILEYSTSIRSGFFASPNKKYFIPWKIVIKNEEGTIIGEDSLNIKQRNVFVSIDSSSLGDTLAWVPQILKFGELHGCNLIICTFFNHLFKKDKHKWIEPGSFIGDHEASYNIGYFLNEDRHMYTPVDPRTTPLGKVAADILGIDYREESPVLDFTPRNRKISEKYVCIATQSTAGAKLWHREHGWQDVIDYLNLIGYKVVLIQKETDHNFENIIDESGDLPIIDRMNTLFHADFFIGLGSGLSWLAWSLKKPVILISGFSDTFSEFQSNCHRIINRDVCNSCWNDTAVVFDKGDWNWCPRNKGTSYQFECTKNISCIQIIEAIKLLSSNYQD